MLGINEKMKIERKKMNWKKVYADIKFYLFLKNNSPTKKIKKIPKNFSETFLPPNIAVCEMGSDEN